MLFLDGTSSDSSKEITTMKKLAIIALGLGLMMGTVSFAAQEKKTEKKAKKAKKSKKTEKM